MITKTNKKTRSVTFRIEEEDYKALKKFAEERERTISFVLNKFTKKALSKNQNSEEFFEPHGLPTLKLSDEDTKRIEAKIENYISGKSKVTTVSTKKELHNLLTKMAE